MSTFLGGGPAVQMAGGWGRRDTSEPVSVLWEPRLQCYGPETDAPKQDSNIISN